MQKFSREVREQLKEAYESEYQKYYKSIHVYAVKQYEREGGMNRIIDRIESYGEQLRGQLDFLKSCGFLLEDNDYKWWKEQDKKVIERFDSYTLFGVIRSEGGYIHCRNSEGKIEINDKEMWKEAESKVMERQADNKKEYQVRL